MLYKALSDENRRMIIMLLLKHSYCVAELARKLDISESAVSQHIKVLKESGLLKGEKRGYFMHYGVERGALLFLAEDIKKMACANSVAAPGESVALNEACKRGHEGEPCPHERKLLCHGTDDITLKNILPLADAPGKKKGE